MKIKRKQVDQIREMTTDQLIELASRWVTPNTDEFLFVECAKYELKARKAGSVCGCDDCFIAAGWQICA